MSTLLNKRQVIKKLLEGNKNVNDVLGEQREKASLPKKASDSSVRKVSTSRTRKGEKQAPKKPRPRPAKPPKKK